MKKFLHNLFWDDSCQMITLYGMFFSIFAGIIFLVGLVVIPTMFCGWKTAVYESQLYNEMFGTKYTVSQFFWAGSTIKDYLNKGEQKTFNINGLK